MKKTSFKFYFFYIAGVLIVFVWGSIILYKSLFIALSGLALLLFSGWTLALIRKLIFLEKQNNLNMERFAVSLEHVSNVLFDNILEADITNDSLIGENTVKLTQLLQIPETSSYSQTIDAISRILVDEKYSEEYRKTLSIENVLETLKNGGNTMEYECIERSDGENYRWIRVHYCIYKSEITNCVRIISYVKNIDDEKQAYHRLMEKATTDQMTGVLNRTSTKEVVTDLLEKHCEESNIILMIDIDDFKSINDIYGHNVGDQVVISICNIIKNSFRDTDIVGRMGGDEFLVCLREKFSPDKIKSRITQLLNEIQNCRVEYNQQVVHDITVSIGIVNTFGNMNFDELYHYADVAMYQSKAKGKNQYSVYDYAN